MDAPKKTLAVLIVEDVESDAQLVVRLLKKAGYDLVYEQVETAEQMRAALEERIWDVVISDYSLPQFNGEAALALLKKTGQDIPFLVVSGTVGEETAVAMMRAGANDYLVKGNLARLPPAVERELSQVQVRRERKQTAEALQVSTAQLQTLVQVSPLAIIMLNVEGKVILWNSSAERIFGWQAREVLGLPNPIIQIEKSEEYGEKSEKVFQGQPIDYETVRWRKDGSLIHVNISSAAVYDDAGNMTGRMAIIADITERKQAEEALAASEAELRALFASMQDVVLVIDREGVYRKIAPTNHNLLVRPAEELLGRNLRDVFFDERAAFFIDKIRQVLDTKQISQIEYELLIDNRTLWFEAFISPMDKDCSLWVARDVTARKQAENALAASEAELRALVEQVPAIVYTESAETRETMYISPQLEKMTGYAAAEWISDMDLWKKVICPEDRETVVEHDRETTKTHEPFYAEYRILTRDGRTIWIHDEAVMVEGQDGTPLFWQGVMYDITERKQIEEFLQKSEKRYRQLFNSMIDGFALHEIICDENGKPVDYRFLEANPAFERLMGFRSEHLIGRTVLEVMPNTEPFWIEIYGSVALTGHSAFFENYSREVNRYFEVSAYCPSPGQFAVIMVDVSERKRTEEDIRQRVWELEMLYQTGLALSQLLNPKEIGEKILQVLEEKPGWHHTALLMYNPEDQSLKLLDFNQPGLDSQLQKNKIKERINRLITKSGDGMVGWALQQSCTVRSGDVSNDPHYIETYPGIHSGLYTPIKLGEHMIGVIGIESEQSNAFSEADERLIVTLANQAASAFENARLFEETRQRVTEMEMLYQSGLLLSQLLNPKEIGQKILELLEENLGWRHTRIRLYHPQDDSLELLDFNYPGLNGDLERHEVVVRRFQPLITRSGQGMSGWVVQHGQPVRCGDVSRDPRYIEAYPGIHSGLYVPMKLGERVVGVISIEDERPNAFVEADERLIVTLANQAASAFENARLFEETRQRVMELETLNRISLVLRAVSKQNEMLSIVLDEALTILNTSHGVIEIYNQTTDSFEKVITRGWLAQVVEPPQRSNEGISGKVFTSGEMYVTREFATDPEIRPIARAQIPPDWGGACLPIRTSQKILGIMLVSVPSERELNRNEIRLLSILSEMTGAALQRMQLHEQTVHRLEQLNALRAVDQAISSSRDMRLTLSILLTHTMSQLNLDAANVFLFHPGSNLLEAVANRGFHTHLLESVGLHNSFAGRAILEHRSIMTLDFETARQDPQFGNLWKQEGFICYWCLPLTIKGEVKGALEVYCRKPFTPDTEWIEFLEAFAGQAAIAIDNTQLFENLQGANMDLRLAYDATIEGWSRAMDLRDHETEGHTLRVTDLTVRLAYAMRVNESQLTAIRRGALLHDIGKIGVPDAILHKEGTLTDEEWQVMRTHPELARDMLMPIAYLNDALSIPYCHHEKWDGTGYPQGLKGNQIPLMARIFAVVDVWDALTTDRPYRKMWSKQKAHQYIREQSGKHFDPQVVDAFLKIIEKD